MKAKRTSALLAAVSMLTMALLQPITAFADSASGLPPGFDTAASAMALIEAGTGTLLAEQNKDRPLPMASTTKIMTALVVLERCEPDELVEVDDSAVGTEGSSMYLCRHERISVRDLLYGLMLASGNDAAVALACHVSGSVEAFAELMNARAAELGLAATHFVTPNGLTAPGHHTTAYELCIIAREALENSEFREIVSTRYYSTTTGDHPRTFKNKNALLWDYEGALGVKTGYTEAAGRCLVFAAEKEGMTVIGVLLNCRPMFEKAALLMDHAFDSYSISTVVEKNTPIIHTNVINGKQKVLAVGAKKSIMAVMHKNESASFEVRTELLPALAPLAAGDILGTVSVYLGGELVGSAELIALEPVERRDAAYWFSVLIASFLA